MTNQRWATSQPYLLRKLLGLLHGLLHNLGHGSRWLLCLALFKLSDLMAVVGMVGIIWVEEIKLWVVDFILANPRFKLWPVSVMSQNNSLIQRRFQKYH